MTAKRFVSILFLSLACRHQASANNRVSVDTILGKHMTGYQGWFTCEDGNAAKHWLNQDNNLVVDMLPDVSEYDPNDLCDLPGYKDRNGNQIKVFSSQRLGIVDTHFRWMQEYGIDGAFLQHHLSAFGTAEGQNRRMTVARNVKNSAEKHGRAWAIMFDVSGSSENTLSILQDIMPPLKDLITNSSMYLKTNGKPLVAVWGFGGKEGRHLHNPTDGLEVIKFLKEEGFSVFGGMVRDTWANNYNRNAAWTELVNSLDVISPWTTSADALTAKEYGLKVEKEMKLIANTPIIYSPVIFPGFSWKNLKDETLNAVPRNGGRFYENIAKASIAAGAKTLYTAMFDEVDEGTAIMKTLAKTSELPTSGTFLPLDFDGVDLDSDHFLKLAGNFSRSLKSLDFSEDTNE